MLSFARSSCAMPGTIAQSHIISLYTHLISLYLNIYVYLSEDSISTSISIFMSPYVDLCLPMSIYVDISKVAHRSTLPRHVTLGGFGFESSDQKLAMTLSSVAGQGPVVVNGQGKGSGLGWFSHLLVVMASQNDDHSIRNDQPLSLIHHTEYTIR